MKLISLLVSGSCLIWFNGSAASAAPTPALQLSLESKTKPIVISLNATKTNYVLSLGDGRRQRQTVQISTAEAEALLAEVGHLVWEQKYRRPASLKSATAQAATNAATLATALDALHCQGYARIQLFDESLRVCQQNARAVGVTYGIFNSLAARF